MTARSLKLNRVAQSFNLGDKGVRIQETQLMNVVSCEVMLVIAVALGDSSRRANATTKNQSQTRPPNSVIAKLGERKCGLPEE